MLKPIFILLLSAFNLSSGNFLPEFVIEQGGKSFPLTEANSVIHLSKNIFSVSFNEKEYKDEGKQWYSLHVAVAKSNSIFSSLKPGITTDDVDYFSGGTGCATLGPYEEFSLTDEGNRCMYIMYEKNGEQRARLISETDDLLRLKFDIEKISDEGKNIPLKKIKVPQLHFVFYADTNLNDILEEGEFRTVTIVFDK